MKSEAPPAIYFGCQRVTWLHREELTDPSIRVLRDTSEGSV